MNWYAAPLDLVDRPFRFPWSAEVSRKLIRANLLTNPQAEPAYVFKFIQNLNRYCKEPIGYYRARPLARGQEYLDHQLQCLDFARVQQWIEAAAQVGQSNLSRRLAPVRYEPVWKSQGKMNMSRDMSLALHDNVNIVLGPDLPAEWEDYRFNMEIAGFDDWKRACELWRQQGRVSKRMTPAAANRAEIDCTQLPSASSALAISLEQLWTVAAPASPVESPDEMLCTEQSSEHPTELTPLVAPVERVDSLNLDTDTETLVSSPRRRAMSLRLLLRYQSEADINQQCSKTQTKISR